MEESPVGQTTFLLTDFEKDSFCPASIEKVPWTVRHVAREQTIQVPPQLDVLFCAEQGSQQT